MGEAHRGVAPLQGAGGAAADGNPGGGMSAPSVREAQGGGLEGSIPLHQGDELGSHGDVWSPEPRPAYEAAFAAIQRSPDNRLFVAADGDEIVGTFQLTFIPNLTGRGAMR